MFKNKLLKISMISMVLVGGGVAVANATTSCGTAKYDTRASISVNSLGDYYNFFSSKKAHQMISHKKARNYSLGYTKENPLPSSNDAPKFDYFWNNGYWEGINKEMMSEMTAGDMCVLMMVCLNYLMLAYPVILDPALLQNVDNINVDVVKMPFDDGADFIIDMGFTYHPDEGKPHTFNFYTPNLNSLWLVDDTLDLELNGTPSYIDTLYSVKGFDSTRVNQEGEVQANYSENIWQIEEDRDDDRIQGYLPLQMYGLVNPVKLIFPSYTFPVYDVVV